MGKTPKKSSAGSRKKRRHRAPLLSADVTVTAKKVTDPDVECEHHEHGHHGHLGRPNGPEPRVRHPQSVWEPEQSVPQGERLTQAAMQRRIAATDGKSVHDVHRTDKSEGSELFPSELHEWAKL